VWSFVVQVPLRRVNPAYVIGTSVTIETGHVNLSKISDADFKAPKKEKGKKKTESEFFGEDGTKKVRRT
jgi:hypothetical protein